MHRTGLGGTPAPGSVTFAARKGRLGEEGSLWSGARASHPHSGATSLCGPDFGTWAPSLAGALVSCSFCKMTGSKIRRSVEAFQSGLWTDSSAAGPWRLPTWPTRVLPLQCYSGSLLFVALSHSRLSSLRAGDGRARRPWNLRHSGQTRM